MNSSPRRSRLAVVTTVHRWGDPRVFERNAKAAVQSGLEVHAFVPMSGSLPVPNWAEKGSFRLHPLPLPGGRFERMLLASRVGKYISKAAQFDAVHFHDPELIPAMMWLSLWHPKLRILYDIHEELPLEVFSKSYIPGFLQPLASGFVRLLWKLAAHRFHAFAPATEAIAAHWPADRTLVVHNYPKSMFNLSGDSTVPDPNRVVFIGALTQIHGIEPTLQAVSSLRREFPQLRLELYGKLLDTALQPPIDQAVREKWCEHIPWLEPSELAARLRGAGVGLIPYAPLRDHVDALPTKMFEYMALGIPILASDFPLWKRIIQDQNVGLCRPPSSEGIADGLRVMLGDPERLQSFSTNGRELYQQKYRWEVEVENLRRLYQIMGMQLNAR